MRRPEEITQGPGDADPPDPQESRICPHCEGNGSFLVGGLNQAVYTIPCGHCNGEGVLPDPMETTSDPPITAETLRAAITQYESLIVRQQETYRNKHTLYNQLWLDMQELNDNINADKETLAGLKRILATMEAHP